MIPGEQVTTIWIWQILHHFHSWLLFLTRLLWVSFSDISIMHYPDCYYKPNENPILTLTLTPGLSPQRGLWSCDHPLKCPTYLKNVLTLPVEEILWYSLCSKYNDKKDTHLRTPANTSTHAYNVRHGLKWGTRWEGLFVKTKNKSGLDTATIGSWRIDKFYGPQKK